MIWDTEVHISLSDEAFGQPNETQHISDVEAAIMAALSSSEEFTGNEFGGGEAVLFFAVENPVRFLRKVASILVQAGLIGGATATVSSTESSDGPQRAELGNLATWEAAWKSRPRAKRFRRPKPGDYYAVPLPDERWGHLQYLIKEPGWGDFVQVLDVITTEPAQPADLIQAKPLFPPVGIDVATSVKRAAWKFLGNRPMREPIVLPPTRSSTDANISRKPGVYSDWVLLSGPDIITIGRLAEEYRALEYHRPWLPEDLATRIATGINPYADYH
jgi:hypothetical protein